MVEAQSNWFQRWLYPQTFVFPNQMDCKQVVIKAHKHIQGILKEDKYGAGRIYVAHQMWARCASELNGHFNHGFVALGFDYVSPRDRHLFVHAKTHVSRDESMLFTTKNYIYWQAAFGFKDRSKSFQEFRYAHSQEEDMLASKALTDTKEENAVFY